MCNSLSSNNLIKVSLLIAITIIFSAHGDCMAGEYLLSAHGKAVQRPNMTSYAVGNCAHCHEQHASVGGSEPTPNDPAGPDLYLGAGNEEDLCYACHDTTPVGTAPDIQTDIASPGNFGHLAQNYLGIHRTEETLDDISQGSAKKHIECTDCHNPHLATQVTSTRPKGSNAITDPGPLVRVTGADPDYFSTTNKYAIWETPPTGDYTIQKPATKEYQICFKCHSLANANVTSWGETNAGAWTDVGLEFNPYNRSGHPIVTGLNNYSNSLSPKNLKDLDDGTAFDQLLSPWTAEGNQTMYCSDCHTGKTAIGPHGSDVKWMLNGPNKAWPYLLASNNGSSLTDTTSPSLFRQLATIGVQKGYTDGVFCANCHPISSSAYNSSLATNDIHANAHHINARCIDCHIRVPHGGKVSRLIAAAGTIEDYNSGPMPIRYTADGNGKNADGTVVPVTRRFTKRTNTLYHGSFDCYVVSTSSITKDGDGRNCSSIHDHPDYAAEAWDD